MIDLDRERPREHEEANYRVVYTAYNYKHNAPIHDIYRHTVPLSGRGPRIFFTDPREPTHPRSDSLLCIGFLCNL